MRSGRAYLGKRPITAGVTSFETRELRLVLSPAPAEQEGETAPSAGLLREPRVRSELEKNQWSVVSFTGVEAGGLTYDQAARLIELLGENDIHGLCIITDAAALQIH